MTVSGPRDPETKQAEVLGQYVLEVGDVITVDQQVAEIIMWDRGLKVEFTCTPSVGEKPKAKKTASAGAGAGSGAK
jgi:hypothetical protein